MRLTIKVMVLFLEPAQSEEHTHKQIYTCMIIYSYLQVDNPPPTHTHTHVYMLEYKCVCGLEYL